MLEITIRLARMLIKFQQFKQKLAFCEQWFGKRVLLRQSGEAGEGRPRLRWHAVAVARRDRGERRGWYHGAAQARRHLNPHAPKQKLLHLGLASFP